MDAIADKTPPDWITESLDRSEAQIEAGQTVPLEPVLDRLRASIARMTAVLQGGKLTPWAGNDFAPAKHRLLQAPADSTSLALEHP